MPCVLSFVVQSSNKITPAATPCSTFRVWRWPVDGQTFVTHHHQCNHQHHQCNHHHWWFTNATTTNVIHHHHCNHQIVKIQWPGHQWCLSTFPLWTVILNGFLNLSSQLCLVMITIIMMTTDNIFRTFHCPQFVSGPASTGGATWLLWQFWLETFARTSRPAQTLIWRTNTQIHKCKTKKYKYTNTNSGQRPLRERMDPPKPRSGSWDDWICEEQLSQCWKKAPNLATFGDLISFVLLSGQYLTLMYNSNSTPPEMQRDWISAK